VIDNLVRKSTLVTMPSNRLVEALNEF